MLTLLMMIADHNVAESKGQEQNANGKTTVTMLGYLWVYSPTHEDTGGVQW